MNELPTFDEEGRMILQSKRVPEYKEVKRGRVRKNVWRVLVEWTSIPREEATWADYDDKVARYPNFILEDKDNLLGRGSDRTPTQNLGETRFVRASDMP